MELKSSVIAAAVLAALCVVANAMSIPQQVKQNQIDLESSSKDELSPRATWLDTREIEDDFNELVYRALTKLAKEGRIPSMVEGSDGSPSKQKRGRWQGFCFKRTRSGRFLPYICWKGDRK